VTTYKIPLSPKSQTFSVVLGGQTYNLRLLWAWLPEPGVWLLDISDNLNNPLVQGIPLVTGCDLLEQYNSLNIGGSIGQGNGGYLFVGAGNGDMTTIPTYESLGVSCFLWWQLK